MKSTLAIYITLSAVAAVAVAQILYWKLVIKREQALGAETRELTFPWPEVEIETAEPRFIAEPVLAGAA